MHLQWLLPGWAWLLALILAAGCLVWTHHAYAGSKPAPSAPVRRLLVALRAMACLFVLLAAVRPLLISLQVTREPALVAVVVEDSGSMSLRDHPEGLDRWAKSWRVVAAIDSVLNLHADRSDLVLLRGNGLRPLRETTLEAAMVDTPRAVGTDLPALVTLARQSLLARPLRALVVLSDGHSQDSAPPIGPLGLPLWLAGVGDVSGPPDRFLADLRYPDRIQRGESVIVEVAVGQHTGSTGIRESSSGDDALDQELRQQPVTVRLLHEGEVVDTRTGPGADLTRWELEWTAEKTGLAVLEVEVEPLDNERFQANNRATLAVDVQKDRSRVLILAPSPGWDLRFLLQGVRRQAQLEVAIARPGPEGPVLAETGAKWQAPTTVDEWGEFWDAVVLLGPPGALLPDGGSLLAEAVRRGLGLLAIAGDPGTDDRPRPWTRALQSVLPAVISGDQPVVGQWMVRASRDVIRHPILDGITHGTEAAGVLAGWPPLRRLQMVRQRPEAEVLLQASSGQAILVAGTAGEGRSLWFGGRRLWELAFWRMPSATVIQVQSAGSGGGGRLLQQMLLWTALGDQSAGISLLGQRLVYEEGEFLPVAVRWLDLRGEPVAGRSLAVEVARTDGSEARVHPLRTDPLRPGISTGELPPLPPGSWRLTPQSTGIDPETGPPRTIVVTRSERELTQVRQDWRNLRQTAARLGGAALDTGRPDHVERLLGGIGGLDLKPHESRRQSRHEPAAGWLWLAIVVALLSAEWVLRRRHGLL